MKTVQVSNVRSLKDTGRISLSPITILVGENSSGKSTFLRLFPLIRQSIQKKTNGPLLWAGDVDDYVDFGSYNETITNDGSNTMRVGFTFELTPDLENYGYYFWGSRRFKADKTPINVHYTIDIKKADDSREYVSRLGIELNDIPYDIHYKTNGKVASVSIEGNMLEYAISERKTRESEDFYYWHGRGMVGVFGGGMPDTSYLIRDIYEKYFAPSKKKKETYSRSFDISMIFIGNELVQNKSLAEIKEKINLQLSSISDDDSTHLLKNAINYITVLENIDESSKQEIENVIKLFFLYVSFADIESFIDTYFRQVHYIAPLRATAERYYRLRNSAIDEVDYQGKNLAIFLNSLPTKRMTAFQKWTIKHFGFKTVVHKTEGHLSVNLVEEGQDALINLSDSGFGYSQILPIITQLWELSSREKARIRRGQVVPLVVAIEQPELHLHPAMQAKLAEAFIACLNLASENGYSLQLLIETHSETIINYLGRSVERKKIAPESIAVVLFERDKGSPFSIVSNSGFDEDGYLYNWPIGFFEPGE